ncbi:NapH/MauN family ferredoxin-type protein [Candidatus Endoriftia persephone]|jgi:ferredoxin-type protein NapH|uniref:Methylamine utilization ferredoxin-type protein MauN n=3 Tax=Gammaproteobacteria TaxID=1236 RepID=G2FC81_9GAMM|nr:NapH/MauN family ferredoxin-type protein [Candidatus Endoriftia persephone]EGV52548.1 polyferredoxin NapH [endosymbiont of Riftia pachyptila (vent Ph05)]EGW55444.1 methylamine utilization ferredoxin-type protein MauN [endosymbiont of Tevnia jerichonana (vent Tica)]USF86603.1 NapH/MauN family ferredoxin-type protein [Candidatus Endoriftia persephone]
MRYIRDSLSQIFGAKPRRPAKGEQPTELLEIYQGKKGNLSKAEIETVRHEHRNTCCNKWQRRRWITLILVNLLFVVSYYFDVQLLEGALTASRFVGFHMADLNSALQVALAYKHIVLNLVIGTTTVFVLWLLLGGRTFCSWVCPYHLLSEWAEYLHLWLVKKKIIKNHSFHRGTRTVFYLIFALLALLSGYTVFETISPTGILSRALIYGPGVALLWVGALLLFEVFYSRRAWCRYVCPIGVTYGVVGVLSPVRVKYNAEACHHEGDCRKVCLVPHVLDLTIRGAAYDVNQDVGADCTRCGMCVDVCPTSSLTYEVKGLNKFL